MMIEGLTGITKSSYTGNDLISRQDAIEGVKELFACADIGNDEYGITYMLENLSSADRPTGKWIMHIDDLYPEESTQECSNCHKYETIFIRHDNYCPNCGARMKGEE